MTTAQKQASDPKHNCWVGASAGTGKTKILIDRLVVLMLLGNRPESILCITFTKAAAIEMQNRLLQKLQSFAVMDMEDLQNHLASLLPTYPTPEQIDLAKSLFFKVLDTPGGLRIQTIHSFCQSILQKFPIEAGVEPCFTLAEDDQANEILKTALNKTFQMANQYGAENSSQIADAFSELATGVSDARFEDMLQSLQSKRSQFYEFLNAHPDLEAYENFLYQTLMDSPSPHGTKETWEDIYNALNWQDICHALSSGTPADKKMAVSLESIFESQTFSLLNDMFLTKDGSIRKKLGSVSFERTHPNLQGTLLGFAQKLYWKVQQQKTITSINQTMAFCKIAATVFDLYQQEKAKQGILDFEDLITFTCKLLQKPEISSWVFYKLDGGFEHLMIDEAQDTSPFQWEALMQLIEAMMTPDKPERTLFVVGDVKQSIYSFQGARPDTFETLRQELKNYFLAQNHINQSHNHKGQSIRQWHDIILNKSFRTTPAVLKLVDDVFKKHPLGVTEGADLIHLPHRTNARGLVEILPLITDETSDETDGENGEDAAGNKEEVFWPIPNQIKQANSVSYYLAVQIAEKIQSILSHDSDLERRPLVLDATGKNPTPGDILILFRRRAEFVPTLLRELKRRHIPVAGIDRLRLNNQLACMDLLALGRFLCLPNDDYSLACILKSPLFGEGMTEELLFNICYNRDKNPQMEDITNEENFPAEAPTSTEEDSSKEAKPVHLWQHLQKSQDPFAITCVEHLKKWLAKVNFWGPFEIYHQVLRETEHFFIQRLGDDCTEILYEFLQQTLSYQQKNGLSLQGFINFMDGQEKEIKRSVTQESNQVKLMTVHGSKGLQAPIVILADVGDHADLKNDLFIWQNNLKNNSLFLIKPSLKNMPEVINNLKEAILLETKREQRRLLYVALTRAQDHLYVAGLAKRGKAGDWYNLVQESLTNLGQQQPNGSIILQDDFDPQIKFDGDKAPPPLTRASTDTLPEWALAKAKSSLYLNKNHKDETHKGTSNGNDSNNETEQTIKKKRGILIHKILERFGGNLQSQDYSSIQQNIRNCIQTVDQEGILTEADVGSVTKILTDETLQILFGPNSVAEVEIIHGKSLLRPDRLVVDGNTVMVVDYKTGYKTKDKTGDNNTQAHSPHLHGEQLETYASALRKIYPAPQYKVKKFILWTNEAELEEVIDT